MENTPTELFIKLARSPLELIFVSRTCKSLRRVKSLLKYERKNFGHRLHVGDDCFDVMGDCAISYGDFGAAVRYHDNWSDDFTDFHIVVRADRSRSALLKAGDNGLVKLYAFVMGYQYYGKCSSVDRNGVPRRTAELAPAPVYAAESEIFWGTDLPDNIPRRLFKVSALSDLFGGVVYLE